MTAIYSKQNFGPFLKKALFLFAFLLGLTLLMPPLSAFAKVVQKTQHHMGTIIIVMIWVEEPDENVEKAIKAAFDQIEKAEKLFSSYRPDSAVSQINSAAGYKAVLVPKEVIDVLEKILFLSRLSEGAFDPTFASAGKLYDFKSDSPTVPDQAEIDNALIYVGYHHLKIDKENRTVFLDTKGARIGLGGYIKGYAVDKAGEVVRGLGYNDFIINAGGDMLVSGSKADQSWQIGIQDPRGKRSDVIATVLAKGYSVVTSGDYERFFVKNDIRYHHIIDPRTGRPASACQSVTIMAKSTALADGLSTSVFVMGPLGGLKLIESLPQTECFIIDARGNWLFSSGFKKISKFRDMRED